MEKIVKNIVNQIRSKININLDIAIILGSGLSDIIDDVKDKVIIPYNEIAGMFITNVEGHKNQFIIGKLEDKNVIIMQGRFHLYDGFNSKQVCMPIYIFKELGVSTLIVTNAAGGINEDYVPGDLVLICDHINRTGTNCLIGGPIIDYDKQFIDMTNPYNTKYLELAKNIANTHNIDLKMGTYIQFTGPFYETKAEIIMAKNMGADLVGMSTVLEVEAANHCNINVLGLSVVTNKAAGLSKGIMQHEEVLKNSKLAAGKMHLLITDFIKAL